MKRRVFVFSVRNAKEILRDPLNLCFGIGFPVALLLLLTAIQKNIPVPLFALDALAPGMTVFGLSFMTLFSATLIAGDRSRAFLRRLSATPLAPWETVLGYTLPLLPVCLGQSAVCYATAWLLGMKLTAPLLLSVLFTLPIGLFHLFLGLFFGTLLNEKQVGGICGALLTNLSAWLSGIWFDLDLVGGVFGKLAELLPFVHAVRLQQAAARGDYGDIFPHLWWVLGYAAVTGIAAVLVYLRKSRE